MDTRITWLGGVFISMATCATIAYAGAVPAHGEPSVATPTSQDGRESTASVTLEGFVLAPDGSPAEGALVTSSAGGSAFTDATGGYRLEVEVPLEATSVQVTAVGSAGGNLVASASVALSAATRWTRVDPLALSRGSSCSPAWLPTFGGRPWTVGVRALAVYDDGFGPALYVGGDFTSANGVAAARIAKWDGSSWSALDHGIGFDDGSQYESVRALAVYDDGSGPALYVGGYFTYASGASAIGIAKWNGSSWAPVGSGVNDQSVEAMAVYDDGGGPALFVAGGFTSAGGVAANRIAKWDGSSWSALGSGADGYVDALLVYDDGGGPALYAGGNFTSAGGVTANRIAKWDGSSWSALGSGVDGGVYALAVYDDGGGPALYAGGYFTSAGGMAASRIAKWDGSSWSPLGSGIGVRNDYYVDALAAYDDGGGTALYAGGFFPSAGGVAASGIAKWDGSSWTALGSGNGAIRALEVYDGGGGPEFYAGGDYVGYVTEAYGNGIVKWDGASWSELGSAMGGPVNALAVHDDGGGTALYAGGRFKTARGVVVHNVAKWDGSSWSALGSGVGGSVHALAAHDDGSGLALYAGGDFTTAGGVPASKIAKWDGVNWTSLGSGLNFTVEALAVFDDGRGSALFAGGLFTSAGGTAANRIARWDGASWSALGSGLDDTVKALAVYDDGGGPALYAGGRFGNAGGVAANHIARWNGSSWSPLGSGVTGPPARVSALAVYDDGRGPALYAGGYFTTAGGVPANNIARWNGSSWAPLANGIFGFTGSEVSALAVYDDGRGPALCAGGYFNGGGNNVARWNGSGWSALGGGMTEHVLALAVHDDRGGPALFAGGDFTLTFESGDSYLAKWGFPPDLDPPTLSYPSSVLVLDSLGSPPGEIVNFSVTASDCRDAAPRVVCVPPSGSFFPRGTTRVTCKATDASGNRSIREFPVTVELKARR